MWLLRPSGSFFCGSWSTSVLDVHLRKSLFSLAIKDAAECVKRFEKHSVGHRRNTSSGVWRTHTADEDPRSVREFCAKPVSPTPTERRRMPFEEAGPRVRRGSMGKERVFPAPALRGPAPYPPRSPPYPNAPREAVLRGVRRCYLPLLAAASRACGLMWQGRQPFCTIVV